ncbi:hypothetical protein BCF33_0969 [Hasllibacter halocynthiae]|uniref:Uncharacterized protein n=1 Tax=Hasllibacter halocynthiae TaxID=595589 RepID=A0A2T0X8T0_9RHOB|nr:hypothetical protein [Hasllibacter halocynthiae]PRY95351.1 hypothetical protein BCF33_0969 [Hasllibacter halocynthiae]
MIRVEGADTARAAHRVALPDGARGLVPCHPVGGEGALRRTAHEGLAARAGPILAAFRTLNAGGTPKPPYDTLTLTGDR